MSKTYKGNPPGDGELLVTLHPWLVFHLAKRSTPPWRNLKVALVENEKKRKANYRVAWNGRRWANTKDLTILKEREPTLFAQLDAFMKKHHSSTVTSTPRGGGRPRTAVAGRQPRGATGRSGATL